MSEVIQGMKIIVDSREQRPFTFSRFPGVEVVTGTLATGDYSLPGLETLAAIERKSLADLVGCLTGERDRFERELARLSAFELRAVVVEASWSDLEAGRYRSRMNPHAAAQSVLTFQVRHRVPFMFAGSREGAETIAHGLLAKYLREIQARYKLALAV